MGCGTSKQTANIVPERKVSLQIVQERIPSNVKSNEDVTKVNHEYRNLNEASAINKEGVEHQTDLISEDKIREEKETHQPLASSLDEESQGFSEDTFNQVAQPDTPLGDKTVSGILQSLPATNKSQGDDDRTLACELKPAPALNLDENTDQYTIPVSSGAPVSNDQSGSTIPQENLAHIQAVNSAVITDEATVPTPIETHVGNPQLPTLSHETFQSSLNKACQTTDNTTLLSLAPSTHMLKVDRTFYCFTNNNLLSKVTALMKNLSSLDLRGGQCGPIAFRTILNALLDDHHIRDLNLSDNSANPECSNMLGKLLASNTTLQSVNVSGNQLGKDALSRYVGFALAKNATLTTLDVSGCGATDLHCLCESLRNSPTTALTCLIASHNFMSDGNQFGVDLSLVLENENCRLESLEITNTGITPAGLDAISASLVVNTSLKKLYVGQNTAKDICKLGELIIYGCAHNNLKEFDLNKTHLDEIAQSTNVSDSSTQAEVNGSKISYLGIADCGINDALAQYLAVKLGNKLTNLAELDISNNNALSIDAVGLFDEISGGNLKTLKAALLEKPSALSRILPSTLKNLKFLDMTRSRLFSSDIKDICSACCQKFEKLNLSGIKLSGTGVISSILVSEFTTSLHSMNLSGCQLTDEDLECLHLALKTSPTSKQLPLQKLDLSVNRLTSTFVSSFFDSLMFHRAHPLNSINFSNNLIGNKGLDSLAQLLTSESHQSSLTSVDLSCNDMTASAMIRFFENFQAKPFRLEYLDFRNQNEQFPEEDAELLGETLKKSFFSTDSPSQIGHSAINFVGLGGADVPSLSCLDSQSIKTDFAYLRKPTVSLKDIFDMRSGINILNRVSSIGSTYEIPSLTWKDIIGKDAPAWTLLTTHLKKAAYFSSMPGTVTVQRLQGMLEMEADCEVEDVCLIKDPIMRKPTGAAWVLFSDVTSLTRAIEWYTSGSAQMYGTAFSISEIPAVITDGCVEVDSAVARDIAARELEQQKQLEQDRKMMEESERLAAERAEYREAHPAYQGGRIS